MGKINVLVVDDRKEIRELLEAILTIRGYYAIKAKNGQEALELLRSHRVDLVISDINMPKMDGFVMLPLLRKLYPDLPVIMMTGYYDIYTKQEAIKQGANNFLSKPFRAQELISVVEKELTSASKTQN